MTHDELREKVSRAIAAIEANGPATDWEIWLPEADAAIATVREALREVTVEMETAAPARRQPYGKGDVTMYPSIWRAMLAASPLTDPRA